MTKTEFAADASASPVSSRKYATFTHTFRDPWEDSDVEMTFHFAKPGKPEIKRLQDTASKNPIQAARNLLLSIVHPEHKEQLEAAMEEHAGLATTFSTAIIKGVGISSELGN